MRNKLIALLAFVLLIALCLAPAGCSRQSETPSEPVKQYPMRGEVVRLDSEHKIASIKHETIEGWMDAMTMDFPVRDQAEFNKLKPGARIQAAVSVQGMDYWMHDIRVEEGQPAGEGNKQAP